MLQMFNSSPHIQTLMLAVANEAQNEHDALLLKQLARATVAQRKHVMHAALLLFNAQYARLLLLHYKHEISARNISYLEAVVTNF